YLILIDVNGNIVEISDGFTPTEHFDTNLVPGRTYYLIVNGFQTYRGNSGYTLSASYKIEPPGAGGGGVLSSQWLLLILIPLLFRLRR
ncbi:MAG: hypothetical protein OEZ15_07690, partial [Gammaproteobacteria bacterium]|nr:hypothetical protein [Gammaproteobacteria bacterium]